MIDYLISDIAANHNDYVYKIGIIPYTVDTLIKIESQYHLARPHELIRIHNVFSAAKLVRYANRSGLLCRFCNARPVTYILPILSHVVSTLVNALKDMPDTICSDCAAFMRAISVRIIDGAVFKIAAKDYIIRSNVIYYYEALSPVIYARMKSAHDAAGYCEFCTNYHRARNDDPAEHISAARQAYIAWFAARCYPLWTAIPELVSDIKHYIIVLLIRWI